MTIDAKQVNELRQETSAGIMECKRALQEAGGDKARAKELLKKWGLDRGAKLAEKQTKEGRIGVYLHTTGKVGAMVELTCETDFVAKNEEFQDLLRELAIAVAAFDPLAVSKEDLPKELVEEEKKKYEADIKGKPPEIAAKILEGKLEKNLYSQKCLLHMPFPKEEKFKGTYGDFLKSKIGVLKENIVLRRFVRMEVGK
ncbi:MAG TPA: elongation factor Ts [Planctomycetota bacterium]|jgi:elongation factor Ts|nr:elongation factor Ts [Planctomycetota bacterium]